ncbi:serine/threonine-protein kinase [Chondromyces apiculatus]|nr:serine/threonine-protein kinase [Chondromyces apiculatus]
MLNHGPLVAGGANDADTNRAEALIGRVLSNRYRVDALLALGGLGAVYAGEHVHMHKRVAIKVLHASAQQNPEMVRRFEREAVAGAHVQHPNVAAATDFGELGGGAHFLVLEYIQGTSLSEMMGRGPMPVPRALHIARQIASALEAVHAMGIVHRDVKPLNVMVAEGQGDLVKLIDFGFAKVPVDRLASAGGARRAEAPKPLTRAGVVFGTLSYLAPEAAEGMDAIDAPADLYALGLMLYEMVAGKPPFESEDALELFEQQRFAPPPMIAQRTPGVDVPMAVELLILRLLAKEPRRRHADATAVIAAIDEVAAGMGLDLAGGARSSRLPGRGGSSIPPSGRSLFGVQPPSIPPGPTVMSVPPPSMAAKGAHGARGLGALRQALQQKRWLGAATGGAALALGALVVALRLGGAGGSAVGVSAVGVHAADGVMTAMPIRSLPEVKVEAPAEASAEPTGPARAERAALLDAVGQLDPVVGAEAILALIEREPAALGERALSAAARECAVAIGRVGGEMADQVFEALARRGGSEGLDVLYDVLASRGGTEPARRAAALLGDHQVAMRATPAMQVAFELRAASCKKKLTLLERAVEEGDRRALLALESNVRFCFQGHPDVLTATQRLRDRLYRH